MFATIRRYTPKKNVTGQTLSDFKRRIEEKFVPSLQDVRGFHAYYVVTAGKELLSISICEDKTGTTESTRRAADFVKGDPLKDDLGSPEVIEGEVLVTKEAMVSAR
jgi:hypothetical protein